MKEVTKHLEEIYNRITSNDPRPLFVTGAAGTGKSYAIKYIYERLKEEGERVAKCAPTGVAAQNIDGLTVHSLFNFTVLGEGHPIDLIQGNQNNNKADFYDFIIIDEVSMLRADILDTIDMKLQSDLGCEDPFGGKRLILFGDMHQLPPVVNLKRPKDKEISGDYGCEKLYFFKSKVIKKTGLDYYELEQKFRQSDNEFCELLDDIREGNDLDLEKALKKINCKYNDINELGENNLIALFHQNKNMHDHNNKHLLRIKGDLITVIGSDNNYVANFLGYDESKLILNQDDDRKHITNENLTDTGKFELPALMRFECKIGARVMLTANYPDLKLVNGSTGIIKSVKIKNKSIEGSSYRIEDIDFVEFTSDRDPKETYEIKPKVWEYKRTVKKNGKFYVETIGTYTQIPFRISYAVTIHKAQGLTLEKVFLNIENKFPSLAYVGLSRLKSIEGLYMQKPLEEEYVKQCSEVKTFYEKMQSASEFKEESAFYKIYMHQKGLDSILKKFDIDIGRIEGSKNDPEFLLIYVGQTGNMRERYLCHFWDDYRTGRTHSNLRDKIQMLMDSGTLEGQDVDDVIQSCKIEVDYCGSKKDAEEAERKYLKDQGHLSIFNIDQHERKELEELHEFLKKTQGKSKSGVNVEVTVEKSGKRTAIIMRASREKQNVYFLGNQRLYGNPEFAYFGNNYRCIKSTDYVALRDNLDNCNEELPPAKELYLKQMNDGNYIHMYTADCCSECDFDFFIISAGWGVIRGDFPLPWYDITFSGGRNNAGFRAVENLDIQNFYPNAFQMKIEDYQDIHFFATKDYMQYFGWFVRKQNFANINNINLHVYTNAGMRAINDSFGFDQNGINIKRVYLDQSDSAWQHYYTRINALLRERWNS